MTLPDTSRQRSASKTALRVVFVTFLLYLFLVGVKALEGGINSFGEGFSEGLVESVTNPLAGLFVGVLVTVLVQSSSVTTTLIVGAVSQGVVPVPLAVPMVMGANIGTTVTNTLASLGHLRSGAEFRRAFAGATVHDFFNLLAVSVFLPLELATGFLEKLATRLAEFVTGSTDLSQISNPNSPLKTAVKAPLKGLEALLEGLSEGAIGAAMLIVGLGLIFLALAFITKNMRLVMAGSIERSLNAVLSRGAGLPAIVIGVLVTISVQSSSITTSILVPMVGAGVLTLRNAYPVTLGANLGTTATALIAAAAVESPLGLVIALVHLLFNLSGIVLFYPVPSLRSIPLRLAESLAERAARNRFVVVGYVVGVFVVLPMIVVIVL